MELFYHPLSRYSQKVLIALYEKQAHFYPRITDLRKPAVHSQFMQFFPEATLPLLRTPQGELIPDASIIIEYLDHYFYQGSQLLPSAIERNREVRGFDKLIDKQIHRPLFQLETLQRASSGHELEIKRIEKQLFTQLKQLDSHLRQNYWLSGDSFTLADCALIPCLSDCFAKLNLLELDELLRYWHQAQLRGAWMLVLEEVLLAEMEEEAGMIRNMP